MERLVGDVVVRTSDLVGSKAEDGGVHEVDDSLREGIGDTVD